MFSDFLLVMSTSHVLMIQSQDLKMQLKGFVNSGDD
jgi:hypothetical protein